MVLFLKVLLLPFEESCWTTLTQTTGEWMRNWMSFLLLPCFTFPLPDPASRASCLKQCYTTAATKSFKVLRENGINSLRNPLKPTCFGQYLVPDRMHWTAVNHGCLQTSEHNRIFSLLDSCAKARPLPQGQLKIPILKSILLGKYDQ